nr:BREX-1 system adenine-specific DNA-methyltransferase PglX [Bifidobacterium breve]
MNTNKLQSFAAEARTSLMKAVRARIDTAMEQNSAAQSDNPHAYQKLRDEIKQNGGGEQGRAKTAERHAYRWFNRIIALRYMDANEFTSVHVVSGEELDNPNALPAVLSAAKRGEFDKEVFDSNVGPKTKVLPTIQAILDGSKPSNDPQGDAYGLLLRAYCDYWHKFLPFMFDDAGAADEILMPADLLAKDSVLRKSVEAMSVEDCVGENGEGTVEIIGWLYQFYIAERKTQVMVGFKKSKKAGADEIPAATQLFTPDWIVRYLVQNTVGRLWTQNHPESQLHETWEYYIESVGEDAGEILKIDFPEELTVCDLACGSGHMLTYVFDLLYSIYDEAGYSANEIPGLILEHNLFGMEIDERAANLAAFALTMKARGKYRRFFRKGRQVQPNIQRITPEYFTDDEVTELNDLYGVTFDTDTWNTYQHADIYGSLIQPPSELAAFSASPYQEEVSAKLTEGVHSLMAPNLIDRANLVLAQTRYLSRQYAVVVANPPYMGSGNMGNELKKFINDHYADGKADLFAAFIYRLLHMVPEHGQLGFMSPYVWMFISSYEQLRKQIIDHEHISSLIQLEYSGFDGATVPICTFVLSKGQSAEHSCFVRLSDFVGAKQQAPRSREIIAAHRAIAEGRSAEDVPMSKHFYTVNQHDFAQIHGSPIVYWLSDAMRKTFTIGKPLEEIAKPRVGLQTGNNDRFIREWWEVSQSRSSFGCKSHEEAAANGKRWFPYNKGGEFRKWYGNQEFVVNWEHDGKEIENFRPHSVVRNPDLYFHPSISWSKISSGDPAFRFFPGGFIFDVAGTSIFSSDDLRSTIMGYADSTTAYTQLTAIAPTLNFEVGQIASLPISERLDGIDCDNVKSLIRYSKSDWNSSETSWDFDGLELLSYLSVGFVDDSLDKGIKGISLVELILKYIARCKCIAEEQRQREIKNNELVADAYGVRNEVPCDVPIERVSLKRNPAFAYPKNTPAERDELMTCDIVKEIISYAVGCMFGRYSLNKPGLILASQGETLDDYHAQIPNPSFEPDADNVIPVTEDEWFEDDIVARFRQFLVVALGEQHLEENIAYIEQVLGKSLRKYFVNDFYDDHVKMYKNRPIYWMYSSRTDKKGVFKALVYLHRYTPTTTNNVLSYLRDFTAKLRAQSERLAQSDKASEVRQGEKLQTAIKECTDYERDILYPLATRNLPIDLDDGVLINYLRMGKAVRTIPAIEKKRTTVQSWTWPIHMLGE